MKVGNKEIQHWMWNMLLEILIAAFAFIYTKWREEPRKTFNGEVRNLIFELNFKYMRGGKSNKPKQQSIKFYPPTPIQVQLTKAMQEMFRGKEK